MQPGLFTLNRVVPCCYVICVFLFIFLHILL